MQYILILAILMSCAQVNKNPERRISSTTDHLELCQIFPEQEEREFCEFSLWQLNIYASGNYQIEINDQDKYWEIRVYYSKKEEKNILGPGGIRARNLKILANEFQIAYRSAQPNFSWNKRKLLKLVFLPLLGEQ